MNYNDSVLLLRKEKVGLAAIIFGLLGFFITNAAINSHAPIPYGWFFIPVAWMLAAYWVWLDASYRGMRPFRWAFFTLVLLPVTLIFYFLSRPPMPRRCYRCGGGLVNPNQVCPVCGYQTYLGRLISWGRSLYTRSGSLTHGPVEGARHTAKYMAIALGCASLIGYFLVTVLRGAAPFIIIPLYVLSVAGYWIMTAWWVYLDATWRRMEAIPWAVLTLLFLLPLLPMKGERSAVAQMPRNLEYTA